MSTHLLCKIYLSFNNAILSGLYCIFCIQKVQSPYIHNYIKLNHLVSDAGPDSLSIYATELA